MCLYPKLIKNKKYTSTKKNGGVVPAITDDRVKYVPVGCGNCIECRKQKASSWRVRMLEDIKTHKNGKFVTMTFSDQSIAKITKDIEEYNRYNQFDTLVGYELDNQIATWATRLFLERWRKKYKKSLRHWLVTELGHNGTENIHLHGIIWTNEPLEQVEKIWKYGWMWKGKKLPSGKIENYVNERTVNYIVKYINKADELHKTYKSKVLTSAGIGHNYVKSYNSKLNKFDGKNTNTTYKTRTGHKMQMPIYWRNKIYSEQEREKLWLQKLDEEVRWVMGEKVNVSKSDKGYWELVKWYREQNKRLGYGGEETDQEKVQYEKDRRILMLKTRIAKAERLAAGAVIKRDRI